jgi:hypothetical protein
MEDSLRAALVATAALALLAGGWAASPPAWEKGGAAGLEQASHQALELQSADQPLLWRDDGGGTLAAITPAHAWRDGSGRWCRSYSVELPQETQRHLGCRDEAGNWTISPAAGEGVPSYAAAPQLAKAD